MENSLESIKQEYSMKIENAQIEYYLNNGILSIYQENPLESERHSSLPHITSFLATRSLREIIKEQFSHMSHRNLVERINIQPQNKYAIGTFFKNATYYQNPEEHYDIISSFYDISDSLRDYRLHVLYHAMGLSLIDKKNSGKRLKICVSSENHIDSLRQPSHKKRSFGMYFPTENTLYLSSTKDSRTFLCMLLHNAIFKLRFLFKQFDKTHLDAVIKQMKESFHASPSAKEDEVSRFMKAGVFSHLEKLNKLAVSPDLVREEIVAEIARILLFGEFNPQKRDEIQHISRPLLDYFDKKMLPRLEAYILQNKNLYNLLLPEPLLAGLGQSQYNAPFEPNPEYFSQKPSFPGVNPGNLREQLNPEKESHGTIISTKKRSPKEYSMSV